MPAAKHPQTEAVVARGFAAIQKALGGGNHDPVLDQVIADLGGNPDDEKEGDEESEDTGS
jgi:hypothetical protein